MRARTDATGMVTQTYQTDEFVATIANQGSSTQRLHYTGQERDEDGRVNLRSRAYNPALGRFMGRDPLPGIDTLLLSFNRYAYAMDNPVGAVDPTGLPSSRALDQPSCLTDLQHNCPLPLPVCPGFGPYVASLSIPKVFCWQLRLFCDDEEGGANSKSYRGGAYGDITGFARREAHHMPAKAFNGMMEDIGPAIQTDKSDHLRAKSYGGGPGNAPYQYRKQLQSLIEQGKAREAMDLEIQDIRSRFGNKYDDAIQEILDYARRIGILK